MCCNFASKLLVIFGVVSYVSDIGTDIGFNIQLYKYCHLKYALFSLVIIVIATLLSMYLPSKSAGIKRDDTGTNSLHLFIFNFPLTMVNHFSFRMRRVLWT